MSTMNTNSSRHSSSHYRFVVYQICIIAALGGLLFGLDQGFIANSFNVLKSHYSLTLEEMEFYSAVLAYGGIVGALSSGFIARLIGRKKSLILAGFLFTITTVISAMLPSMFIMKLCRFFIGFAVGMASFIVPLYLSETAPKRIRGSMGTLFQLMITIGIFLISVTNVAIINLFDLTHTQIPLMFLVVSLFASIMFFGSFTLPESPRWLALKGREAEARRILSLLRKNQQAVDDEMKQIHQNIATSRHGFDFLKHAYFWKILVVCVLIQCFQQLVGINMMIYYAPTIFGYASMTGIVAMMLVPTVNVLFTFPSIRLVEKMGRKKLLYMGSICMLLAMLAAGFSFYKMGQHAPTLIERSTLFIAVIVYIFGFAVSWGPVAWILCSELFPQDGREFGMTVSTMVNWTFAGLVMSFSLTVMQEYGNFSIFFIFSIFCFLSILFVRQFVPETKNVMLEKIESDLKTGVKLRLVGHSTQK